MNQEMDLAQIYEQKLLRYQEPMNAVIDRGDSPVQQFYRGATVLVTGGSGFLGKQLIEKLFRSCEINKLYILLRPRKGKSTLHRMEYILRDPVFDLVRKKKPNFADRIQPVEGDITELKLGLSEEDWSMLTDEVDMIFHGAATTNFDAPLKEATLSNVRGTREILTLARRCWNLKSFVYISTAYSHATIDRVGEEVLEQFYESSVPPELLIHMAETFDVNSFDEMIPILMKKWPNTYTFTKSIAEELIRLSSDLPICVVKPPIVIGAYYEPSPGWLDINAVSGASGIIVGGALGITHVFYAERESLLPLTPVDYVNNCTIAAGWDAVERRKRGDKSVPLYIVSNKDAYCTWKNIYVLLDEATKHLSTPKAIWYTFFMETRNKAVYKVLSYMFHYIPAYILDAMCYLSGKKPKQIKSFVDVCRKMDKFSIIFDYFLNNKWYFDDTNVKNMLNSMTVEDRAIFNCNVNDINIEELLVAWGLGIRKYIIKDGFNNSAKGHSRQKLFCVAHYSILGVSVFMLWKIASFIVKVRWVYHFQRCVKINRKVSFKLWMSAKHVLATAKRLNM